MHFQFVVAPPTPALTPPPLPNPSETTADLLRQILEVQREQAHYLREFAEAHNQTNRWQAFLSRWEHEFPDLARRCRDALPTVERFFLRCVEELATALMDEELTDHESDFRLTDLLDRHAMRISQLGTLLNLLGPMAEGGHE